MTPVWLRSVQAEVVRRLAAAAEVFCFLDYDGTLSPLAPTPEAATPLPGTAPLLHELAAMPGMHVAIVSGRQIAAVRRFVDIPGAYYVGVHGLEVSLPGGEPHVIENLAVVRGILPAIRRRLELIVGGRPGILIEDKGAALACHFRLAAPADGAAVRQVLASAVREYQQRGLPIALLHGHAVAEVRPAHINKGSTACALLAAHAPGALPLCIGDDQTDEEAFKQLPADAVTVRVGPESEPTRARYRAATPQEVQDFLRAVTVARVRRPPAAKAAPASPRS